MSKEFVLLLIILLALALVAGYLYLYGEINSGERQIANGQRLVEKGQTMLENGKAKLAAGKQELSEGKKEYEQAKDNLLLVSADKLLKGGKGFKGAKKLIAEGDQRVDQGVDRVALWEKRLDAYEQELHRGRKRLWLAKGARIACALGAVIFAALSLVLGFRWRRSLPGS